MKYVFIDLGAYNGDSIEMFMQGIGSYAEQRDLPAKREDFDIYAFEPNPKFASDVLAKKDKYSNIVEVSTLAAYIDDGEHDFAVDPTESPLGSTLMRAKKNLWRVSEESNSIIKLKTFDFSEYTEQFKDDYLVVKMDIEGAEYPILEKMLKNGTITNIDRLWVEMHPNKVVDYTTTYTDHLIKQIQHTGVEVTVWH